MPLVLGITGILWEASIGILTDVHVSVDTSLGCYFTDTQLIFNRYSTDKNQCHNSLLQQTITWYKIRHVGGQAHYYSRTGTFKQRDLNQSSVTGLCFSSQCGNNNELALQYGGFCTM